jgi:hypothetical protein
MSRTVDSLWGPEQEYQAAGDPRLIDVAPARHLIIEGMGAPEREVYQKRLECLLSVARKVRSEFEGLGQGYAIGRLEAFLWGVMGPGDFFLEPRSDWNWRLSIRTPEFVEEKHVASAIDMLRNGGAEAEVARVRILKIHEGRCVQVLHLGPIDEIRRSVERMSEFVREQGLSFHGLHHEIYLTDPREVVPELLRTIVRMPVC